MIHLEELLLQLDVSIRDGLNEPVLDFEFNGGIATITYLHTTGELVYPVYEFIDGFVGSLLDILQFIDTDLWGDLITYGTFDVIEELLWISFVAFIWWDPMVHSCITLLSQDAEQIVKAFLSLDFAQPKPSLKHTSTGETLASGQLHSSHMWGVAH